MFSRKVQEGPKSLTYSQILEDLESFESENHSKSNEPLPEVPENKSEITSREYYQYFQKYQSTVESMMNLDEEIQKADTKLKTECAEIAEHKKNLENEIKTSLKRIEEIKKNLQS